MADTIDAEIKAAIGWANPQHRIRDVKALLLRERIDDAERLQQSDMKLLKNEALAKHKAELELELSRLSGEGAE